MNENTEVPRTNDNINKLAKTVFNRWTIQEIKNYCLDELSWSYEQDPDLFQSTWDSTFREDK